MKTSEPEGTQTTSFRLVEDGGRIVRDKLIELLCVRSRRRIRAGE